MKLNDVPTLNCTINENKKILIEKFKSIKYVANHLDSYDIKKAKDVHELANKIIKKCDFSRLCIFYDDDYYTSNFYDNIDHKIYTVYSVSLIEMDMKIAIFSYYFRKNSKASK